MRKTWFRSAVKVPVTVADRPSPIGLALAGSADQYAVLIFFRRPMQCPSDWKPYEIEQTGESGGRCDCCGAPTRRVWGLVNRDGKTRAAYFVTWTEGRPDHGAAFDLVLGRWGRGASRKDRHGVALDFRVMEGAPQFTVVDADGRFKSGGDLFTSALQRSDVIGTPLAPQVFAVVDAVYLGDPRLDELLRW